jgi:hypothetical protein
MSQQWVRHVARRSALDAQAARSRERVDRELRLEGLAVEVVTPLGERTGDRGARSFCAGSTGRRSTPWLAPPSTPRSGSLTPDKRLLTAAGRLDGTSVEQPAVDLALLEMAAKGTALDAGQADWSAEMCSSGPRLQLAIAPAGAGTQPPCTPSLWPKPKMATMCSAQPGPCLEGECS